MGKKNIWKRRSWNRYDFFDELTKEELKTAKRLEDMAEDWHWEYYP